MYEIVKKIELAPKIFLMDVKAPKVAKAAKPGQFIILIADEKGERVPLTICDYDLDKGTVTIVIQAVGYSTNKIVSLKEGDSFKDFAGPLGRPSEFINEEINKLKDKKILFVAGGVGAAPVYPQVKWLSERGVKTDVIIGGRSKEYVILEDEMKKLGANVYPCTDDGSYGFNGRVTDKIKDLVDSGNTYDEIIAIGPMIMMKFVCSLTKELGIPTIVSLNTLMVDGTGMCGACRVTVGNETKFACVDGPEFDGHLVDFNEAMKRQAIYKTEEGQKLAKAEKDHTCTCKKNI
ncbi:sulfide/dihydroorotate dehydrogenase-like FAD/NAD-binding protein [Clostridium bornimense]|uniref:sulfide/dihydroorotate dehydrogenase-like FAD/NAD-binding protein n=1 Tax=Clostridium bornimense TaxID=1216932 RepID=UPI001C11E2AA|nr:sulfide/dihydroorotate dehydrogenase-like FAD/NAD-binding protein [Clostridium bornimense]MBU5316431.1 sulfide/dihydroorotate dehydrogenase-like FAD/NAD-binding protein [Clostridium bornimense]